MAFDFLNFQYYSIDYLDLFNELNSKKILSNKNIQSEYLKLWMKNLEECDKIITNQLKKKEFILKVKLNLQLEPEIFQLPMVYENNKVFIHFRVSAANEIISKYKMKSKFVSLDEYVRKDSRINWTPVNSNVNSYSKSKEPIVMIPFLNGQYDFLVIDGNHRLTYKTKNNINDIEGIFFSEKSVIDFCLFSSVFDKLYYIMHNELNHMANATYLENEDVTQLLQKSYLKDGKFKFPEKGIIVD
ncbi:hypothetical protein OW763_16415 [Clostridium aestuarii]|uniref:ParB/Sulfiredoxin domain-containing protein n=1 Tax=Clostridium aestuarii TaxID=338193 RepID=A0ABT4D3U2_9CLOT|nr:hypothetical protein [Clostridium aestuarii]MCY6485896.1 hypothetical protein [Clostridium aestuarii]